MKIKTLSNGVLTESRYNKIIIYGNGEKLLTIDGGIKESRTNDGKISTVYDGTPEQITLNNEIKNARKENLNRTDNYTLSYSGAYYDSGIALYIHCSEIMVEPCGEYISSVIHGETNYKNAYLLKFANPVIMERLRVERIEGATENFKLPEGARFGSGYGTIERPVYDVIDRTIFTDKGGAPFVVKRWREGETITEMLIESTRYTRTEKDAERVKREKIADIMNENKIFYKDVSHYEIENLLKHFNVTLKEDGEQ